MHTKIPKPKVFPERIFLKKPYFDQWPTFFEEKNEKYGFQKPHNHKDIYDLKVLFGVYQVIQLFGYE